MTNLPVPAKRTVLEEKLKREIIKKELIEGLPHKYAWPWYKWARTFYESTNRVNLLTAGNQLSKSSTQIRKCIEWAGNPDLWPRLWRTKPSQFWYLYPTKEVAGLEFITKWEPEFMPKGKYKDHPTYGWQPLKTSNSKLPNGIKFNSGVTVLFKSYAMDKQDLQTATVYTMFCDEELPENIYDELMFRLSATDGYFHMVFTATLGQPFWYRAMERIGQRDEALPDALKMMISAYDCQYYEDGSPSPWTDERIARRKRECRSDAEIQRRIYGRFVTDESRLVTTFDPDKHYIEPFSIPNDYRVYSGVDIGSGGKKGHPAAIVFAAVTPSMDKAFIYKTWRGSGEVTTAGDILEKYQILRAGRPCVREKYDWASKEFGIIAGRCGESFVKADKTLDTGFQVLNTLFKNDMLLIFDTPENRLLGDELLTVSERVKKNNRKDDLVDATRYALSDVPFDWSVLDKMETARVKKLLKPRPMTAKERQAREIDERRGDRKKLSEVNKPNGWDEFYEEITEWNDFYGS